MSRVNFGLLLPTTLDPAPALQQFDGFISASEDLGFHSLWTLERFIHPKSSLDSLTSLIHAAAITKKVKVGTSILLAVFRDPVTLAKTLSTMDYLSNGRVIAGLSVGGRDWEYRAVNFNSKGRGVRLAEMVGIMRSFWTETSTTISGKFYNPKDAKMFPKPVQSSIPILLGGNSEIALARAGRIADGYLATAAGTPEAFKKNWSKVLASAEKHGRDKESLDGVKLVYAYGSDDKQRAYDVLKKWADGYYMTDYDVKANCIFGNADDCRKVIDQYIDAGVKTFILGPPTTDVSELEYLKDKITSNYK